MVPLSPNAPYNTIEYFRCKVVVSRPPFQCVINYVGKSGTPTDFLHYLMRMRHKYFRVMYISPNDNYSRPRRIFVLIVALLLRRAPPASRA